MAERIRDMTPRERERYVNARRDKLREAQERRREAEPSTRRLTRQRRQLVSGERDGSYETKS